MDQLELMRNRMNWISDWVDGRTEYRPNWLGHDTNPMDEMERYQSAYAELTGFRWDPIEAKDNVDQLVLSRFGELLDGRAYTFEIVSPSVGMDMTRKLSKSGRTFGAIKLPSKLVLMVIAKGN